MCLSRITPTLSPARWKELDTKLNESISDLHHLLGHNQIPNDVAADQFCDILADFLEKEPEFKKVEREFFKKKESTTLEEAKTLKTELRRLARQKDATHEIKEDARRAERYYLFLKKRQNKKDGESKVKKHENAYKKNFYQFAKDACNGDLDKDKVQPKFGKEEVFKFYSDRYSSPGELDTSKLDWFVPAAEPVFRYDQASIRPCEVKNILKKKSPNTAPGEDGLLYGVLAKLPSVHHFLATLYTKTHETSVAPASWATSMVVLLYKAGDEAEPSNFRLIALTSCIGKPYHQIKADRMA